MLTLQRMRARGVRPKWAALLLSPLAAAPALSAAEPRAPNDNELRSMYCVSVVREEIGLQQHLIASSDEAASNAATPELRQQWISTSAELLQRLQKLEGVLGRLQAYMLPRIPALDSLALGTAIRKGDADFQESRAIADRCAAQCDAAHAVNEQLTSCSSSCSDNALLTRVNACDNPTWLP
jgi:hypothetical protein